MPCSRAMLQGQRKMPGAFLSRSFQLMPLSHLLLLARERDGWSWHGPEGMRGGSLQIGGFQLCSLAALQLLEKDDELLVSSLAIQTVLILRTPRKQPKRGWALWALCCWRCKARQK